MGLKAPTRTTLRFLVLLRAADMQCTLCQSETFKQTAFIVAVALFVLAWGTHIKVLLE